MMKYSTPPFIPSHWPNYPLKVNNLNKPPPKFPNMPQLSAILTPTSGIYPNKDYD